jgi:EmrB/QacA subfamily drug resistance transporter
VSRDADRQHFGLTLAVLAVAALAFALLQTMVAPALPAIARELHASTSSVTWVLTIYLLSASVTTPILGRLGDMFGKERVLVAVLVVLGIGTVVAALSSSLGMLIAGRAIQGAGGAIFPLAFGIIRDEFPPRRVGAGIGLISATFGIGGGGGLVLAGVIVDHLSYEWIFWMALVLIVPAIVATHFFVPESPIKSPARIDWAGAAGLGIGLSCVLLAVSQGHDWGWGSGRVLGLLAGGAAVLALWARFELRAPQPMVDMRMMRLRGVWTTNLTALLTGFGMFGAFLLLPQLVQMPPAAGFGFGATVTEAGLFLLPSAAVMLVAGPLAGALASRFGGRVPLLLGVSIAAASFVVMAAAHGERWEIYLASALNGTGIGLSFAAMATLIVDAVPQGQTGVATGMNTIMRTIGGALGAQVAASVVSSHIGAGGLPQESGFVAAFIVSAGALGLAVVAGLLVPGRRASAAAAAVAVAVPHGQPQLGEPRPASSSARP